jgi:glucosylceramidase
MPDARPDARADAMPDARADARADAMPDAMPDARADARADAMPDARADAMPDARADAMPDARADPRRRHRRQRRRASVLAMAVIAAAATLAQVPPASAAPPRSYPAVAEWLTTGDQTSLLAPQPALAFGAKDAANDQVITVKNSTAYQRLTGFGAALTDSSAWLLSQLPAATLNATLQSLFGPGGLTVVRVPLGSSDFVVGAPYSYDDLPATDPPGATDAKLSGFSIARDETYLIPLLRSIRAIDPTVQIVASPWSAPGWMKTRGSLIGGTLSATWTATYAHYLVLALQAFAAAGVTINALTLQDEPEFSPGDYPGMTLTESQEAILVSQYLGPDLRSARLATALLGYDDNWDDTSYPSSLLADKKALPYLAGVAFHCYAGDVSAQSTVHRAAPKAAIWMDECSGGSWSTGFAADLVWETRNLFVGATRNWATAVLWWNLALDPTGGPHVGGCADCRGVVTVDPTGQTVTDNVEYWALAQASIATRPGAVRIFSTTYGNANLESTAFRNPDGTIALLVVNSDTGPRTFQIQNETVSAPITLQGGSVATFSW